MPQQVQFPLMSWLTTTILRSYYGVPCDGGTNIRRLETIDNDECEMSNVLLGHGKKRRKLQAYLCFKLDYVDTVISCLRDDNISTIGIIGMCGVGKTSLAMELYNRVLQYDMLVGWVSMGVDFATDIYQLQEEISGAFGFDLEGDKDEIRRSGRINKLLSRNKKCVLFLDDLWGDFRREDVGIPRKCKLVLISRSLDVCRVLGCEKVIKVEPLSEEESWELFQYSVGDSVLKNEEVSRIRELVFNKCRGLPLAITELAKSLRKIVDDRGSSWMEVLQNMDPSSVEAIHLEETFSQLKKSYDSLSDVVQCCFLYCALFPKGFAISREKLIRLWIGDKLIKDVESLQAQYDMGHSILNKLINSCLLETFEEGKTVKIHDFVREMALSIAKDNFMVKSGKPSELEFCGNDHVVSCIKCSISMIKSSTSLKCTNLSTLLLQHNPFELIPDDFFLQICSLRVLNLSGTRISRLPNSIAALEELRVLDLSFCQNLKQVSSLAKLLKLQFLDLSWTAITMVPSSLRNSKKLRELNLSCLPGPAKIPGEVLVSLIRLKRLVCYIEGTILELQKMKSLEILEVRFSSLCELGNYVRSQHWRILESYHLQVGGGLSFELPHSKRVVLQGCSFTQRDTIMLPGNALELYVEDCRGFCNLSDVVDIVADSNKNNQNFASVDNSCNGQQKFNNQVECHSCLEICSVSRCNEIETLFSPGWKENLQSLQTLQVEDCDRLKEMIKEGNRAVFSLPQLRQLALTRLPLMTSIYKGRLVCASLQSCTVLDCPKLNHLPFVWMDRRDKSFPSRLEWIKGHEKWWEMLEWDEPESKALLEPLFRCKSLPDS